MGCLVEHPQLLSLFHLEQKYKQNTTYRQAPPANSVKCLWYVTSPAPIYMSKLENQRWTTLQVEGPIQSLRLRLALRYRPRPTTFALVAFDFVDRLYYLFMLWLLVLLYVCMSWPNYQQR